ncbi:recombination regulator RecX [Streptomyces sp. CRN 30]|uniref:recombination regulator RecX n=1 Tax=Streptomyces sp. CRN 30 TaxID=3075613 RepID=UPI002A7F3804|nr:recombination regulator RecX [Streptomyces sp. CRN 30]
MTRRTDWAEYARPVAPDGPRGGDDADAAEAERMYGGRPDDAHPLDDGRRRRGGRAGAGAHGRPDEGTWPDAGPGGTEPWPAGDGPDHEDGGRAHGGGPRGGRGRGRRRRDADESYAESSGGRQDGGSSSSSRAEEGESSGDPVERARAICLRLLTGTPRTRKQLADALRKREIPEDVADQVLSRFEEVGLIDDSAFADAWVESRHHGRGLARRALAQELRTKGVDPTLIDQAVSRLDSDQEESTARELVARKLRSTRGLDRDKRLRRLAGMLARKGYSQGLALKVVRQALEDEGEDTEGLDEPF